MDWLEHAVLSGVGERCSSARSKNSSAGESDDLCSQEKARQIAGKLPSACSPHAPRTMAGTGPLGVDRGLQIGWSSGGASASKRACTDNATAAGRRVGALF